MAEIGGGRVTDDRSFRQRGLRAAEAGAIADRVDPVARWCGRRRRAVAMNWCSRLVEHMAAAERAKDLARRLEAVAEADGIDLEDPCVAAAARRIGRRAAPTSPPGVFSMRVTAEP